MSAATSSWVAMIISRTPSLGALPLSRTCPRGPRDSYDLRGGGQEDPGYTDFAPLGHSKSKSWGKGGNPSKIEEAHSESVFGGTPSIFNFSEGVWVPHVILVLGDE